MSSCCGVGTIDGKADGISECSNVGCSEGRGVLGLADGGSEEVVVGMILGFEDGI